MSAFAVVLDRRAGDPLPALERVTRALAHRAVDGSGVAARRAIALAHFHHWTTPEDVGSAQPLDIDGLLISFCGRIDNRDDLVAALSLPPSVAGPMSDAQVFALCYERWREATFERLLGPYAIVVAEPTRGRVLCARDPVGDRGVFFHLSPSLFAAASEEAALLALPGISADFDRTSLARFFAPQEPLPGRTYFQAVEDLPPGFALEVSETSVRRWEVARIAVRALPKYRRDQDYVEHYREVLGRAVAVRLRSAGPANLMMSGGLDSTALAAVSTASGQGGQLGTISYVFDELASCDEREFIQPVIERLGLRATFIPGDGEWPLKDADTLPNAPNNPLDGPYRRLRERIYEAVAASGIKVLLTGEFGDELYAGGDYWLSSLLRSGRGLDAARGCLADLAWRRNGLRPRLYSLRGAFGRLVRRGAASAEQGETPWLTDLARELLGPPETEPAGWPRPSQAWTVLHSSAALSNVSEPFRAARWGIEVRRPYRDRRLIELMLGIPGHLLYRPGWSKWILREAMRSILPEKVRQRAWPTTLLPLIVRGLQEREAESVESWAFGAGALWRPYVREDWLRRVLPARISGPDGATLLAIWRCLCIESWRRGLQRVA